MKIIFYKTLLTKEKDLTPTERIIYSFLVSKSITLISELFDSDGTCLNVIELYSLVDDDNWIDLYHINNTQISQILNIARKTVTRSIEKLKSHGYIQGDYIHVTKELLENGYFELQRLDILTGELAIFYSFIKHKSLLFGGSIDTYKTRLAECLATTKVAITKLLNRLYALNLAKRLSNGKLMIM